MLLSIISIIANVVFYIVLNIEMYTDRTMMPNGQYREWQRSPISRLRIADQKYLLTFQIILAAISVITSLLVLFGINNSIIKWIQRISTAASAAMFIIIMIVTSNSHVNYV